MPYILIKIMNSKSINKKYKFLALFHSKLFKNCAFRLNKLNK